MSKWYTRTDVDKFARVNILKIYFILTRIYSCRVHECKSTKSMSHLVILVGVDQVEV